MPMTPVLWNIPYQRNPFFTGREEVLNRLYQALHAEHAVALSQPQGITGLGGIGKTQTVLEYAYRYWEEYDAVFWVRADSLITLTSSMVNMARILELPERNEQDQTVIVQAVLRWLRQHSNWLLIYDNIDNLSLVEPFLPQAGPGHLLFTTRSHALGGLAQSLDIQQMEPQIGALLLLRRAGLLAIRATLNMAQLENQRLAQSISQELDGLPLALDQAGAYIKETPCSLEAYLDRYQTRRSDMLRVRGGFDQDYPSSVATTWSLSFEKVSQASPAAAELLHFCAFLAPDAIPEELITKGASHLGPILSIAATSPLQMNQAYREVLRFSLLHREAEEKPGQLTMHRLVQAVLKDGMDQRSTQQWAESALAALNAAFPFPEDFHTWNQCERLVPHAVVCKSYAPLWDRQKTDPAELFVKTANYLSERAQYSEVESLYVKAQDLAERVLGSADPNIAHILNSQAIFYSRIEKYEQAEPLFLRSWTILSQALEPDDPDLAHPINNLANLYRIQGKYEQAESLHQQALSIREQSLGSDHTQSAYSLLNLANTYGEQGKYQQAEILATRALSLLEQKLEPEHPGLAQAMNDLAILFADQGRYKQAEKLHLNSLRIREDVFGQEHPDVAQSLVNLANVYAEQDQYEQAESLYQRAASIAEHLPEPNQVSRFHALNGLAIIFVRQGKYEQAEILYLYVLETFRGALGPDHPWVASPLIGLAELLQKQKKYAQAEPLYLQALTIRTKGRGLLHLETATSLHELALFYEEQGNVAQAKNYYQQASDILEKLFGSSHSYTQHTLKRYVAFLSATGQTREAQALRSRLIRGKAET